MAPRSPASATPAPGSPEAEAVPSTRRHVGRWLLRGVAVVVLVVAGYLGVTAFQVWTAGRHDGRRPADAILVLGAAQYDGTPSPVLRARLDHVIELYDDKVAPMVVVTGGKQPGDRFTEATASVTYLRAHGVPESKILRETQGRTSWQSLAAAATFLKEREVTDVVLVSDPYHAARVEAMARELGLDATVSPTRTSPVHGTAAVVRYAKETVAVAAGRIVGFRRIAGGQSRVRGGLAVR